MSRSRLWLLLLILGFAFITRIWRLAEPPTYIFDEVYHAVTVKLIAKNNPRAYEWWHGAPEPNTAIDWLHPPLAKYTQALGVLAFGENTFGWRISAALFGVGVVYLTYLLARELFSEDVGLLAAFLASLDGLLLVQSRIAMNDIHVTFFILLTLWLYVRFQKSQRRPLWLFATGLAAGLAMSTKWSGVFTLPIIGIAEVISWMQHWREQNLKVKELVLSMLRLLVFIGIFPFMVYVLSYSHMFVQGKTLICTEQRYIPGECYYEVFKWQGRTLYEGYVSHFTQLHRQIWSYQTGLTATHDYQSRPWEWFWNLRPVWFHVAYAPGTITNVYAFGNPVLFWAGAGAVIWSIGLGILSTMRLKQWRIHPWLFFLILSYLMVWLPWQLSPRIMFFYHYTPAVPLLSIVLAFWLDQLSRWQVKNENVGRYLTATIVLLIVLAFGLWYPHWTSLPVSKVWAEPLYFAITSWR